ncbi:hypothetical protein [Helicobacter sp. 11S02629-2]|uniref:hypothetical protein n=1 Tax=Helicobacter sp. 11S02629-2 TaxID=1476195 RepID=UPI000BA7B828|nr:hypothetical protein [Helicobacter sp. 11S02629-2]PAF44169.1 hypothetical protein BKH40_06120 [Helicobacter sp. 11S02629-2]
MLNFLPKASIALNMLLIIICAFFIAQNHLLKKELENLKTNLISTNLALEFQNKALQNKALDLESYKAKKPKVEEKIITKYQKIYLQDDTCESELNSAKRLLNAFYNNNTPSPSN